ncbi:transketolase C-terminal domain-containing protein [Roseovarius pacificus]|uniref:transketolase family protein n=1 Tax=Roseovarius pacificus TaxID=337701 RepID=UPI002A188A20|nr:transketolase C-terminal domain-containing protein [Roseovarius pacificus]
MRQDSLNMVYEFAKADPRVVFVGSDLGAGVLQRFREEMPERFFMEGVNEAAIVGMAAGMAAEGCVVYVNTIAPFFVRRAYEQIALDVCLHNLDVRFIANGGGMVYAPLGPTHMAIEDFATMRVLPNMNILAPADAPEMRRQMRVLHGISGPCYIRLGKGNEPDVTPETVTEHGRAVEIRAGDDVLVVTTGVMLHAAFEAADRLQVNGISAGILHCPWVKPLDFAAIEAALAGKRALVTAEEHVAAGGLGGAVAEWLAESALAGLPFRRVALPDFFPDHYGSQAELMAHHGIDAAGIVNAATHLLARG